MFTIILAAIHGFSRNNNFKPELLYFGTVIIDCILIVGIVNIATVC